MIHRIQPRDQAARLGFTESAAAADAANGTVTLDWHWLIIAALAALVIFQALDRPNRRKQSR